MVPVGASFQDLPLGVVAPGFALSGGVWAGRGMGSTVGGRRVVATHWVAAWDQGKGAGRVGGSAAPAMT